MFRELPKILLSAPSSQDKDYCFDDWSKMVNQIDWPNMDVLIVDNSRDPSYHLKIIETGFSCIHNAPTGTAFDYVTESQNIMRREFLAGDYDYLFSLETDVFVPSDILQWLALFEVDVISCSYFIHQGLHTGVCLQGITDPDYFRRITPEVSFSLYDGRVAPLDSFRAGPDTHVYAPGIGCTLIKRRVLEKIEFRVDRAEDPKSFSDSFFHNDINQHGFDNYLDTTRFLEHRRQDWAGKISDLFS